MVKYYLAGYYLVQLQSNDAMNQASPQTFTCSSCIHEHLLAGWSYAWSATTQHEIDVVQEHFGLSQTQFQNLQSWADEKLLKGCIGWPSVFQNIETAFGYKNRFFQPTKNVALLALYVDHDFRNELLEIFKPASTQVGAIGLYQCLEKSIAEPQDADESLLSYDYIGIEISGDFHSFHCHQLADELVEKFGLTLNENGLFEDARNQAQVEAFLNADVTGCEPVPWGAAKVKCVKKW